MRGHQFQRVGVCLLDTPFFNGGFFFNFILCGLDHRARISMVIYFPLKPSTPCCCCGRRRRYLKFYIETGLLMIWKLQTILSKGCWGCRWSFFKTSSIQWKNVYRLGSHFEFPAWKISSLFRWRKDALHITHALLSFSCQLMNIINKLKAGQRLASQ